MKFSTLTLRSFFLLLLSLGTISSASATVLFSDSFTGYTGVNVAPAGWTEFSDGGIGTDAAQSSWWQSTANTTGSSPEGDADYVRAYTNGSLGEGLAITLAGFSIGQQYSISFFNAASVAFSGGDSFWDVFIDGSVIASSALASVSTLAWESNFLTFTATSAMHQIGFRGRGGVNALLDAVVVADAGVAVSAPATLTLMALGLMGIAARRRKGVVKG
ncbi:PEP-CTERM sorting domain-containing protein [Pseudomonadota bacterium]